MNAVEFVNVSKIYRIDRQPTLKKAIVNSLFKQPSQSFKALTNISFTLEPAQILGLAGANGSGKTTILKLIAGITKPTSGTVTVHGSVVPLIEMGVGFHEELTGRENVYLSGAIFGMTHNEVENKLSSIVKFSGIKKFLDVPLKKYSTGMKVRLGISVALYRNPDILLLDESLATLDENFKRKFFPHMKRLLRQKKSIVLVNQDELLLKKLCHQIIRIEAGKIVRRIKSG